MALNITSVAVVETTRLHLENAVGEKLFDGAKPVEIELYGKGSKQYRNALAALSRKNTQRKNKPQSFDTNVEDGVEILVTISKTSHNLEIDGVAVTTPEAFRKLYSNPQLFFVNDQVQATLDDNSNFLQK